MKMYFTLREYADYKLPGLPGTVRGLQKLATREGWEGQQRLGKGGGYEYHISNLPHEARQALEAQLASEMLTRLDEQPRQLKPVTASLPNVPMTHRQRAAADARVTIINTIESLRGQGVSLNAALTTLLTQAETGQLAELNPVLDQALRLAKDSRGRGGHSPYPSARSLKRWLARDVRDLGTEEAREGYGAPGLGQRLPGLLAAAGKALGAARLPGVCRPLG